MHDINSRFLDLLICIKKNIANHLQAKKGKIDKNKESHKKLIQKIKYIVVETVRAPSVPWLSFFGLAINRTEARSIHRSKQGQKRTAKIPIKPGYNKKKRIVCYKSHYFIMLT